MKRVARETAVFAFYLLLAIALTWPLARSLDHAVSDPGDPLLNAFILDWDLHSFTHAPLQLFDAPILYPGKYPLAYSENMVGTALLLLPFHLLGATPIALHDIAMLLGFALSGYGAFVLARLIVRSTVPSLIAGVLYGFVPFKWDHLSHVQIISSQWLPLLLASLIAYRREPSKKRAALVAAAFAMNGLTNIYWLLFGGFATMATLVFFAAFDEKRDRAYWLRLGAALLLASLVLLPFLIPYQIVAHEYGMRRRSSESLQGSATLLDWLAASGRSAWYGGLVGGHDERRLFPGMAVLVLALCAVTLKAPHPPFGPLLPASGAKGIRLPEGRGERQRVLNILIALFALAALAIAFAPIRLPFRGADVPAMLAAICLLIRLHPWLRDRLQRSRFGIDEWAAALWIGIGFLGSLGEHAFLHPFLFRVVEPFRATRIPARWAIIAYVGLAVWAAIGASRLRIQLLILALAIADVVPVIHWTSVTPHNPALYRRIEAMHPHAIVDVPMLGRPGLEGQHVLAETIHRAPNFAGTSGFEPPVHEQLWPLQYRDGFVELLARYGGALVVLHTEELGEAAPAANAWLACEVARGCLRLEFREGTDAVYRITCDHH
jgi:hypothetical protein